MPPPSDVDFRLLFETAADACLVVMPDAPRFTIVAVSDDSSRATGRHREALVGRGLFDASSEALEGAGEAIPVIRASLERVIASHAADAVPEHAHRSRRADGVVEERIRKVAITPVLGADGGLAYVLLRLVDVTDVVRLEEQLGEARREANMLMRDLAEQRRQEAERERLVAEADARRRWLEAVLEYVPVGVVLYEPSGTVYVNRRTEELLGMKVSPEGGSAQYAHRIQDLLDVTRIEGGAVAIERARVPVRELLTEVLRAHEAVAEDATVDLRLETSAEPPDRFWQASRVDRRGTGLGLTIVKGLVEAHRGSVWVESTPGTGAKFCFTVPRFGESASP